MQSTGYTSRAMPAGVLTLLIDNSAKWGWGSQKHVNWEETGLPACFVHNNSRNSWYLHISSGFRRPQETQHCLLFHGLTAFIFIYSVKLFVFVLWFPGMF